MNARRGAWLAAGALIAVAGAAAAGCGSPLTTAQQTQTAAAATPTVSASSTTAPSTGTPATAAPVATLAPATPAVVQPLASGAPGARTDCPAGWPTYAAVSMAMTLCSPSGLFALTGMNSAGEPTITVASDLNGMSNPALPRVALSVGLSVDPGLAQVPTAESCLRGGVPGQISAEVIQVAVDGALVPGCHFVGESHAPDGPLESIYVAVSISTPPGQAPRFLTAMANWRTQSAGAAALVKQMLNSLRAEK